MHTAILLLSLGMAVALAAGSLGDHAELITSRNIAAQRSDLAAQAFVQGCASEGCQASDVQQVLADKTQLSDKIQLSGCISGGPNSAVLQVQAALPWQPQVLVGLTPAKATTYVDLGGFTTSAMAVLPYC
ncbi:MAG: hypothetical protein OXF21_00520 [bacterium]|nr:hypothetical protein [bacterium]